VDAVIWYGIRHFSADRRPETPIATTTFEGDTMYMMRDAGLDGVLQHVYTGGSWCVIEQVPLILTIPFF
jgi:hypothetical protein